MKGKYMLRLICVLVALASPAFAQTLTPEALKAKVAEGDGIRAEYYAIMDDPDPAKAASAVKFMMESGDPELERMARDYAIFSPHAAVQRAALEAFFNGSPRLEIFLDGSALTKDELGWFSSSLGSQNATVDGTQGHWIEQVGKFDEDKGCWVYKRSANYCLISLSENQVTFYMWQKPVALRLDEDGRLVGKGVVHNTKTAARITIPVTR